MSKYTPAPWYWYNDEETKIISIATRDCMNDDYEDEDYTLAGIHSQDDVDFANARLMAAAPELLEALQEIMLWVTNGDYDPTFLEKANNAISKATGGE